MKITGGCHCGKVRYQAEADPARSFICHCTDCQKISGSAYRTLVQVSEDTFRLTSGKLKSYVKTADSGNDRPQEFCSDCGAHIYATSTEPYPRILNIRLGTVDQRDDIKPKKQIWMRSAQTWASNLSDIPGIPEQA